MPPGDMNGVPTPAPAPASATKPKALYLITNQKPNAVLTVKVDDNGQLAQGSMFPTGGDGASGIDGNKNNTIAGPDALFDQAALAIVGRNLVCVNAGSNTISWFTIDEADPTQLTMVGKPADTMGEFPNSVTISEKLKTACVANSGAKSGVSCFSMDAKKGLMPLDKKQRPLKLGKGQTTPPVGPFNTVSQILFTEDSSALMVLVKGTPPPMNMTAPAMNMTMMGASAGAMANSTIGPSTRPTDDSGYASVFPVDKTGRVSDRDVRSVPSGSRVLFGTLPIPGTNTFLATDASFGAGILSLDKKTNRVSTVAHTPIAGQRATCWVAISAFTKTAFVTDVGKNTLIEMDTTTGAIVSTLADAGNGNPGLIDLTASGQMVYALSPNTLDKGAATIAVYDVSGGPGSARPTQNFNLGTEIGREASGLRAFAA